MTPEKTPDSGEAVWSRSFRKHALIGLAVMTLAFGVFGVWGGTAPLSGAVIAGGNLVVESNSKKVQHPTGGVVAEIRVRDGALVKAGELVLRLDETQTKANLQIITKQLDEAAARIARLEAERDSVKQFDFPAALQSRAQAEPDIAKLMAAEQSVFEARTNARDGQKAQLRQRTLQLLDEIGGKQAQLTSKIDQIRIIKDELKGVEDLFRRNLVQLPRLTSLQREASRIDGERGQLISMIAETHGKISEIEIQLIRVDQELRSEVLKEMRELQAKQAEFGERRVAAEDQLKRVDIRAPQDGLVHQLAVHTVGGVIAQGETLMIIVPQSEDLQIEAKVAPQEIDQLRISQLAVCRFSVFNQQTTPELQGEVRRISADLSRDQQSGAVFYTIRVGLPAAEIARLGELQLIAGMPVECFMKTADRTMISYLLKPLSDQINRTFRER